MSMLSARDQLALDQSNHRFTVYKIDRLEKENDKLKKQVKRLRDQLRRAKEKK